MQALFGSLGALGVVLSLAAEVPGAEPVDRFALAWVRAPGAEACPSSPELARLVEATVGIPLTTPTQATVLVDGLVAPKPGGGFQVLIRATTARGEPVGERRLESDDVRCSDVTRSTLLVLAVMINPVAAADGLPADVRDALARRDEQENVATSVPAPAPAAAGNPQPELPARERSQETEADALESTNTEPARSRHSLEASADLVLNAELTPIPSFGGSITLGLPVADAWLARLESAYFPGGSLPLAGAYAGNVVDVSVAELSPQFCRLARGESVRLAPCAGLAAGVRTIGGAGVQVQTTQPYFGALAALDVAWFFATHAFLDARLHAAWMPRDERFVYTDSNGARVVLFDPAPFAGYAALGAGGAF